MKDSNPLLHSQELRSSKLLRLKNKNFDLLVIGAGIHGALTSWIAAKLGYSVILVDALDYGQGTSSRSSKLLHGGVRYLEQGHLGLVYKSLVERQEFLRMAPHLSRTIPFLFSVKQEQTAPAWLVRAGLFIYEKLSRHAGADLANDVNPLLNQLIQLDFDSSELIKYHDGQINDVRFCIEAISEASALGALTLNYMNFSSAKFDGKSWRAKIEDQITGENFEINVGKIANLSGAAVLKVHQSCLAQWPENWPKLTFSTGVHLFFDKPWHQAGLILPAETKGRYYFVLPVFSPYRSGVLVGTTDREVEQASCYPEPTTAEIEQILGLLKRDLPQVGFDRSCMYHATSGTRVLVGSGSESHKLNRNEQILSLNSYATIIGGKYTTARNTATKLIEKLFEQKIPKLDLILSGSKKEVPLVKSGNELMQVERMAAVNRFGSHAEYFLNSSKNLDELINLQIQHCIEKEQAVYWEDIFSRRLNLDFLPQESPIREQYQKIMTNSQLF